MEVYRHVSPPLPRPLPLLQRSDVRSGVAEALRLAATGALSACKVEPGSAVELRAGQKIPHPHMAWSGTSVNSSREHVVCACKPSDQMFVSAVIKFNR